MSGRQKLASLALRQDEDRVDHIVERDGKYVLLSKKDPNKVLGTHATREEAVKQEQAIEASKHADDGDAEEYDGEQGPSIGAPLEKPKTAKPGKGIAPMPDGVSVATTTKQDAQRIDVFRLDAPAERTPQGGLKVSAFLTRTGVFEYRNADGTTRREYRPPVEVFDAASLKSLEDAPVTDLHQGMISASTYTALSKGHVRDVAAKGKFVGATVLVQDAALVDAVERGDRREISCGYACKLDATPGVSPEGEHYDAVQTEIRYNHAALLPPGAGRAGREVALRLDGAAYSLHNEVTVMKIRFDGKDYDLTDAGQKAAFEAAVASHEARLDSNTAALATLTAERDAARADAADARDPAKMAARVEARAKLETQAREILGTDVKFDGLTDDQVRSQAVLANDGSVKDRLDSYSSDSERAVYLQARFDGLFSKNTVGGARQAMLTSLMTQAGPMVDDSPSQLTAWQLPLAASKDKK